MKFFRFILILFHPIIFPIYYLLIFSTQINAAAKSSMGALMLFLALSLVVLPMVVTFLFSRLGVVKSVLFPDKQDKNTMLLIMNVFYVLNTLLWVHRSVDRFFMFFFLMLMVSMLIIYMVSLFYNLDIYTYTFGAMFGYYITMTFFVLHYSVAILVAIILAAGLTGTAQLQVTDRKPRDVDIGFLMGFVVEMGLAAYYLLF